MAVWLPSMKGVSQWDVKSNFFHYNNFKISCNSSVILIVALKKSEILWFLNFKITGISRDFEIPVQRRCCIQRLFSWARYTRPRLIVISTLPNIMHFWDSKTKRLMHPVMFVCFNGHDRSYMCYSDCAITNFMYFSYSNTTRLLHSVFNFYFLYSWARSAHICVYSNHGII